MASAEITFSGKGEAGMYQTGKSAAVAGKHATAIGSSTVASNSLGAASAPAASTSTTQIGWVAGKLVTVAKAAGTMTTIAANDPDAAISAASNNNTLARAQETVRAAKATLELLSVH